MITVPAGTVCAFCGKPFAEGENTVFIPNKGLVHIKCEFGFSGGGGKNA